MALPETTEQPPTCQMLTRHALPALRKNVWDAAQAVDVGRAWWSGLGPDNLVLGFLKDMRWGEILPPWYLTVRFKGESWIHLVPSAAGLISSERVARSQHLELLTTWFDPERAVTCARFYRRAKVLAELELKGRGHEPLQIQTFRSSRHGKRFLQQFATAEEAVRGFYESLQAVPRVPAARERDGHFSLEDGDGRELNDSDIDQMGIVYLVPLTAQENPAGVALLGAIRYGDVAGARQAVADGASLEYLPDMKVSPLAAAADERIKGDWQGVCRVLVEAGAPLAGYEWEDPPICGVNPLGSEEADLVRIAGLLDLGADINAQARVLQAGSTALHNATSQGKLELVRFLLSRGAKTDIRDARGKTALEIAEALCPAPGSGPRKAAPTTLLERILAATDETGNAHSEIVQLLREAASRNGERAER